jgi:hypothetical protein
MPKPNPLTRGLEQQPARRHRRTAPPDPASSSTPVRAGDAGRAGRVLIGGHFAPAVQTALRILAAEERTTMQALLTEAINLLLTKRHKPAIAGVAPE